MFQIEEAVTCFKSSYLLSSHFRKGTGETYEQIP